MVLGFYPQAALHTITPATAKTLQIIGVTDPAPTHAANGSAQ